MFSCAVKVQFSCHLFIHSVKMLLRLSFHNEYKAVSAPHFHSILSLDSTCFLHYSILINRLKKLKLLGACLT